MKHRLLAIGGFALAATLFTPAPAAAIGPPCTAGGSVQTGFGGFFSGCWAGFEVTRLYENAGNVNDIFYFNSMPGRTGSTNSPTTPGTFLFDNNCGSNGNTATSGMFCVPNLTTFTWGTDTELVFGLRDPAGTWLYTGTDASRNTPPMPAGIQNFLWNITAAPVATCSAGKTSTAAAPAA